MTQTHSMVFLNKLGHVEFHWDAVAHDYVRELVEKKMEERCVFFQRMPVPFLPALTIKRRLKSFDALLNNAIIVPDRHARAIGINPDQIQIDDPTLAKLVAAGTVRLSRREGEIKTGRILKTADEIMASDVIVTRQLVGG